MKTATAEAEPEPSREADLADYRAETDRLRVLADFVARPIACYKGEGNDEAPDDEVVSAYNLAVEAALKAIRRAAIGGRA